MKTLKRIKSIIRSGVISALVATLLTATTAHAWQNITPTYNINHRTTQVRLQHGTDNSYAFIDFNGDEHGDLEGFYGEALRTVPLAYGISVGPEYNGGTGVDDIVRAQITASGQIGPVFVQGKYSPVSTGDAGQQLGLVANAQFGRVGLGTWLDIDFNNGHTAKSGELEATLKLTDNVKAYGKMEKFDWQKSPSYSIGFQADF
ncbi:hypothetical protein D6745_00585 [Candidatus Woesearchaeota archaeon]|nr:MAG: hypothetical protein D6745_00585 [Candidatus Woesearchaeota archaeon]